MVSRKDLKLWRSANKRRGNSVCQRIGFIRDSVMLLGDTRAVLSLGVLCEDHGYSSHWCRRIKCDTANYVPIVVPGLSTGSSSSATPTSPTSLPQESVIPTQHPASTRGDSTGGDGETPRMDHQKPKAQKKMTTMERGETRGVICQNGWKILRSIFWMKEFQNTGAHPRVLLVSQLHSRGQKWYRASTVLKLTSRRTDIATSA